MKSIAIIGASRSRDKFGNKAVRAYKSEGYTVFPINPKADQVEGLKAYPSILDVPETPDAASLYVPPEVGVKLLDEIAEAGVELVYVNPGAESTELIRKGKELGVKLRMTCSIQALGINPKKL